MTISATNNDVYKPSRHGITYITDCDSSVFKGITIVVLSTWSLEGPQPLWLTYPQAVIYRSKLDSPNIKEIKIVSEERAMEVAMAMSAHVGGKKP